MKTNIYKTSEYWDEALKEEKYEQMSIPTSSKNENKKALDIFKGRRERQINKISTKRGDLYQLVLSIKR